MCDETPPGFFVFAGTPAWACPAPRQTLWLQTALPHQAHRPHLHLHLHPRPTNAGRPRAACTMPQRLATPPAPAPRIGRRPHLPTSHSTTSSPPRTSRVSSPRSRPRARDRTSSTARRPNRGRRSGGAPLGGTCPGEGCVGCMGCIRMVLISRVKRGVARCDGGSMGASSTEPRPWPQGARAEDPMHTSMRRRVDSLCLQARCKGTPECLTCSRGPVVVCCDARSALATSLPPPLRSPLLRRDISRHPTLMHLASLHAHAGPEGEHGPVVASGRAPQAWHRCDRGRRQLPPLGRGCSQRDGRAAAPGVRQVRRGGCGQSHVT